MAGPGGLGHVRHADATADGHGRRSPLGATAAILTITFAHALRRSKKRYGLVTMCIGGGHEVAGHADERATDEYNLKLMQDRVNSVMAALIARKVNRSVLRAKGYGEFCPEDPGHNEEAWETLLVTPRSGP